jgi:hypothetical protein
LCDEPVGLAAAQADLGGQGFYAGEGKAGVVGIVGEGEHEVQGPARLF